MSSELKFVTREEEDFGSGLLLHDIEEISHALYLHGNQLKALNPTSDHRTNVVANYGLLEARNKFKIQDSPQKDKKSSIWNWRPLKALTHNRNHRFNCCFFLHVHSIEGLPSNFNRLNLCVTWSRKGKMLKTHPSLVYLGMAEFEETLKDWCTINCSRNRTHNSANYEPKVFLLHTSVIGATTLDIGKHWIDLTKLLPMTLEELESEEGGSGKWTTSFKLTGIAKGAMLNVSFGFFMMDSNSFESGNYVKVPNVENELGLTRANYITDFGNNHKTSKINYHSTIPTGSSKRSHCRSQSLELKFLDENLPSRGSELADSVSLLYQKLDQEKMHEVLEFDYVHESLQSLKPKAAPSLESAGGNIGDEVDDTKLSIIERGLERSMMDQVKLERHGSQRMDSSVIEIINVAEIFDWEETVFDENVECNPKLGSDDPDEIDDTKHKENSMSIKEPSDQELDSVFYDMMASTSADLDSSQDINNCYEQKTSEKIQSYNKYSKFHESLSLGDVAESIENDFLNMLCRKQSTVDIVFDSYVESPRDQLLKQFEEDHLPWEINSLDTDLMAEQEFFPRTPNGDRRMPHAEDFGLSPAILADDQYLGSITYSMSKKNAKLIENLETEALMHEWGLNEKDFQNPPCSTSGGFGSPVYVPPAEPLKLPSLQECLGPIIQIKGGGFLRSMNPLLFRNANNGARLIVQVSAPVVFPKAMGLNVIEILQCWASVGVEKMSIQANKLMPLEDITGKTVQQVVPEAESISEAFKSYRSDLDEIDSDLASFENIVPVAIRNFEGLLIEGLRIQSGLPDQESPSQVGIQFVGSSAADKATEVCVNFGSERTSGLQVLGVDELVKHSLSLEDWMRLVVEGFDTDSGTDENSLKLLAAHCTGSLELSSGRDYGTSNKNFIMGLKVQLRDPLRDNEMVGSSMLAMIEVERIPSPKLPCTSGKILNDETDGLDERLVEEIVGSEQKRWIFEKGIPQFKFSEVHITGLNTSLGKELWGTNKQQQSGSRWLLSSGLGRTNKNHNYKSKAIVQSSSRIMRMAWPADVLWSISSHTQGEAATWDEIVGLNVHRFQGPNNNLSLTQIAGIPLFPTLLRAEANIRNKLPAVKFVQFIHVLQQLSIPPKALESVYLNYCQEF